MVVARTISGFSPSVRQVYSMGAPELVSAIRSAAASKLDQPKYWDALLYRSSILSDQFTISHISSILSAFTNFPKYKSDIFMKFILEKNFPSTKGFSVSDITMIMHAVDKLGIFSHNEASNFWHQKISPVILSPDKIKPTISGTDLYRIARFACRYEDSQVQKLLVEILMKDSIEKKINDSHLATSMLNLFVPRSGESGLENEQDEIEPFFATESWDNVDYTFLTQLLNKSIGFSAQWNSKDIICFASAISRIPQPQLSLLGHPNAVALKNLLTRRVTNNLVQFKVSQLVTIFELVCRMGMRGEVCDILVEELVYRVREITPKNCVKILQNIQTISNKNLNYFLIRLLKYDANSTLNGAEILGLGRAVLRLENPSEPSVVARQVMKNLLANLKQTNDILEFLTIYSNLNSQFDERKLTKILARNRDYLLENIYESHVGVIAKSLSQLGHFDTELFCEKIWKFSNPIDKRELLDAIAIEFLAGDKADFRKIVESNTVEIISWISSVPSPSPNVYLMMLSLNLPQKFAEIPDQLKSLENVLICPISSKLILIHIESFADWLARDRPSGQSCTVCCYSEISPQDFVALEILNPINDYFVDNNLTLNRPAEIHSRFVSSRFVRVSPATLGTDLIEHTIQELGKL